VQASFFKKIVNFVVKNPVVEKLAGVSKKTVELAYDAAHGMNPVLDNFYAVEKDKLYRSKQLPAWKLKRYIKKYNIKTVVNLRGENDGQWWIKEFNAAHQVGVQYFNIRMSARYLPSKENLKKLLKIYDDQDACPILIHCFSGSDRTGEAAAIWSMDQQKKSNGVAIQQLSKFYGHLKEKYPAKDFFVKIWNGRRWALNEYDPVDYPEYCQI